MNTRDDFDDVVTARIRGAAPPEAPPHLMDSIVDRVAATPQRRRGPFAWFASAGFRVAAAGAMVVAVLAVAQLSGLLGPPAGTEPSPGASATTPPSTTAPSASETGESSQPPLSPTPSQAGGAEDLVVRLKISADTFYGPNVMPEFTLLADGTVVWLPEPATDDLPSLETRRLTPDGLAEIRGHIFGSGLLQEDASYELERRPDAAEPPGHGVEVYTFTVDDGRQEPVIVTSVQWLGEEEESTYYQPAPERETLDALVAQLRDPESLVNEDAWVGPAAEYEAAEYLLALRPMRDTPATGSIDESEIQWPFDGPLEEYGRESGQLFVVRCGVITAPVARPIVEAIAAGTTPAGMAMVTTASVEWADGNGVVDVFLIPRMPDGHADCQDLP